MTELEQYIRTYFGISEQSLTEMARLFQPVTLERNAYMLQTGRICNQLAFVRSGLVRVYVNTDGGEVTQWISTAGYFLTDLSSWMFQSPARWNIQALTEVELYVISRTDYQKIRNLVPEWNELEKLFIARCFALLEDRVFAHLSLSAEERYQRFFEQNKELFNQVPLQYIASMLGMTPETFSRIRRRNSIS